MILSAIQRESLNKELIKLADIMETCEPSSQEFKEYNQEYRKAAKLLYPELYPKSIRKPSTGFIRTLHHCTCGSRTIKLRCIDGKSQFSCNNCERHSEPCETQPLARDSWSKTFNNYPNE